MFYNQKAKNPIKIPAGKRSRIGIIAEFHGIPSRFPNQGGGKSKDLGYDIVERR